MDNTEVEAMGIRELRKGLGLGLERCAKQMGINVRMLIRYEHGRSQPGLLNAAKIARGLGVRVEEVAELRPALQQLQDLGYTLAETNANDAKGKVS